MSPDGAIGRRRDTEDRSVITLVPKQVEFERPTDARGLLAAKAGRVRFLIVPESRYFMIDGRGAPGEEPFRDAFQALYPVAYTLHFALKKRGVNAPVGGLEGLFWFEGLDQILPVVLQSGNPDPSAWRWRLILPVPEPATNDELNAAFAEVERKKSPPALPQLRVEAWEEGPAAQILHIGPYNAEEPTIATLHEGIAAAGLRPRGRHHEVYVSDPNRTAPERLKTVIRQPVEEAG
jgi:hypothetical protein